MTFAVTVAHIIAAHVTTFFEIGVTRFYILLFCVNSHASPVEAEELSPGICRELSRTEP